MSLIFWSLINYENDVRVVYFRQSPEKEPFKARKREVWKTELINSRIYFGLTISPHHDSLSLYENKHKREHLF